MATVTLNLYSGCRIIKDKNFVVDDIETYLSTLNSVTIDNFQYQRFDLKKKINLDLDQVWQTKKTSLPYGDSTVITKWNYCKITTDTVNYYYFITGYKQVSPKTVELSLEMDTINTFKYYYILSNSTYTLSPKTIVKREHKDRLEIMFEKRASTAEERYAFSQLDSQNSYQNTSDETVNLLLNVSGLEDFMTTASLSVLRLTCTTVNGAYIQFKNKKYLNVSELLISSNLITIYTSGNQVSIPMDQAQNNFVLVIPSNAGLIFNFKTYTGDWTLFMNNSIYLYTSVDIFNNQFRRLIDTFQEGVSTYLFKTNEETLYDDDETNQWYVMYASTNAIAATESVSDIKYVNPVQIRLYSDNGYTISTTGPHEVILYATSDLIPKWVNSPERLSYSPSGAVPPAGAQYVKIAGTTYDFHDYGTIRLLRKNNSDSFFKDVEIQEWGSATTVILHNIESVIFYGVNDLNCEGYINRTTIHIGAGSGSYTGTCIPWTNVNLTDEKLIKCFAFPYAPMEFLVGKDSFNTLPEGVIFNTNNVLELEKPQIPLFNYTKTFKDKNPQSKLFIERAIINPQLNQPKNILAESKLYHSDYYQPKFVYDSFSFPFNLENIDIDGYLENSSDYKDFDVNYIISQNIQSKFLFSFPQYALKRATQDYDNILTVERNNEKALFNNSYINYIKSGGYSYDQKKASSQNAINGITTALSFAGAIASFAATPFTGGSSAVVGASLMASGVALAAGGLAGIARSIHTAQEQDKAINQKVLQAQMQGTSVEGSEDIDILTAISGNKAKLVTYELSDIMKQAMFDLFYYCGYATHEQKVPLVYTRTYFNFVQAEIEYKQYTFNEDIAEDIKNKWAAGITFLHHVNSSWDFDQQYENWEVSLMN